MPTRVRRRLRQRSSRRCFLEMLESRRLLATIEVTTALDVVDAGDGLISLREAIDQANAASDDDTITFSTQLGSTHKIEVSRLAGSNDNDNVGGDLDLFNGSITIEGRGRDNTIISAGGDTGLGERVFHLLGSANVVLKDLTIRGGRDDIGAGVLALGDFTSSLRLENVLLTDNIASVNGGGVNTGLAGIVEVVDSTIAGNSAADSGGGISGFGPLLVSRSTITDNEATNLGGGIHVQDDSGDLTLNDSTVSTNRAGFGAGVANLNASVEINNSTLSGNVTTGSAGAVLNVSSGDGNFAITRILNSTIVFNQSVEVANVHTQIQDGATSSLIEFSGTIFVGNSSTRAPRNLTASTGSTLTSLGHNLLDDFGFGTLIASDQSNVDTTLTPVVEPALADNGGPTPTHALVAGSPAIDAGDPTAVAGQDDIPAFDQRGSGFGRVVDGTGDGTASIDVGAVELAEPINSPPTFVASDPPTVLEGVGTETVPSFASFDPGSDNDSWQVPLGYQVSNLSNPDLFASPPAIDIDGNLIYTIADDAFGTSTFDVTVQDNGGGNDTSMIQTFEITVTGVNDAPTFTIGTAATVNEDSGPQSVPGFASEFNPGPNEDGASADSQILHDEGIDGTTNPLSSDNDNPTDLGTLAHGSNVVKGYIERANTIGNVDVFTFAIEPGFQLDELFVLEYEYIEPPPGNERAAFLAIDDTNSFPYDAQELDLNNNPFLDETLFIGGTVFGLDDLPDVGGGDILPRAGVITGSGFAPPLAAGIYTIYIQQTGPANRYALDFRVTTTNKQSVAAYTVSNVSDPTLFASGPAIDRSGNLTFRPAANANGSATFDVTVSDDGGTDNGGQNTSQVVVGTVTVNSVNDPPTFTAANPPPVMESSGMHEVSGFITSFDPGPADESEQTALAYLVSNVSEPGFFTAGPLVDSNGTLSYTLVDEVFGSVTFAVSAQDDGGTDNGGDDTSESLNFAITVLENPPDADYGDAPSNYPVLAADNGARHVFGGTLFLGTDVDAELDGQPSAAADGDGNDDDGVIKIADIVAFDGFFTNSSVLVMASEAGLLDAWIDFSGDGDWGGTGEQIAASFALTAGANVLSFQVPSNAVAGDTAARFRLSSAGGLDPTGPADDGEVEDHLFTILDGMTAPAATVQMINDAASIRLINGQHFVRAGQDDLFSVPSEFTGRIEVIGTDAVDTITLDYSGGDVVSAGGLLLDGVGTGNRLLLAGGDSNIDLSTGGTVAVKNLPIIGLDIASGVNVIRIDAAAAADFAQTAQPPLIVGGENDAILFEASDEWRMGETSVSSGQFRRTVINTVGTPQPIETRFPHAWQNLVNKSDVNNNGRVTANDALVIINELSRRAFSDSATGLLLDPLDVANWPGTYYDQSGDDKATALDALRVINELSRVSPSSEAESVDQAIDELFQDKRPGNLSNANDVVDSRRPTNQKILTSDFTPRQRYVPAAVEPDPTANDQQDNSEKGQSVDALISSERLGSVFKVACAHRSE